MIEIHRKIMNIKVDDRQMDQSVAKSALAGTHIGQMKMAYKLGHRDARHAAAELAASVETVNREVYASHD